MRSDAHRSGVLFMPEGSVLAHVGRALAIAEVLPERAGQVCFAASGLHASRLEATGRPVFPVRTRPRAELLTKLRSGGSAFDEAQLDSYVRDEIRLLEEVRPEAVIGDFRPSLGISTAVTGTPYVCVTNAFWTKHCAVELDPPESWLATKVFGKAILRKLRPLLQSIVFAHYARPFNKVRRRYGLGRLDDVRDCMCSTDLNLLADAPEFAPTRELPDNYRYIGPVLWEPLEPTPRWLDELDSERPVVYLTMGSTGPLEQMARMARSLLDLGCQVVSTTATEAPGLWPAEPDFHAVRYCPGGKLCELASVVVCHAGNGTIYQALSRGTPVVGVPEFHDQEFNMQRVEALGVGLRARCSRSLSTELVSAVRTVLEDDGYAERAAALQPAIKGWNAPQEAARAICALLEESRRAPAARVRAVRSAAGWAPDCTSNGLSRGER